jgi:hypothetical protein
MKTLIVAMFTIGFSIVLLAVRCNKDDEVASGDKKLKPLSITTEACGSHLESEKNGNEFDTVYCNRVGDTLVIRVEASYFCGSHLVDSLTIENDSLNIYIKNTSTFKFEGSCWCPFAYLFNYLSSEKFPHNYRLYLTDLSSNVYELKTEGKLDCSNLE